MGQACQKLDLTQETIRHFLLAGKIGQDDLHGLDPVRYRVPDLVHLAHSASAQDTENLVVTNALGGLFLAHGAPPSASRRLSRPLSYWLLATSPTFGGVVPL